MTARKGKRTDKERLEYLIRNGHRVSNYERLWWIGTVGAWGEEATLIDGKAAYKKTARKAIDAAMTQERSRQK